jgi:hypothetical protein
MILLLRARMLLAVLVPGAAWRRGRSPARDRVEICRATNGVDPATTSLPANRRLPFPRAVRRRIPDRHLEATRRLTSRGCLRSHEDRASRLGSPDPARGCGEAFRRLLEKGFNVFRRRGEAGTTQQAESRLRGLEPTAIRKSRGVTSPVDVLPDERTDRQQGLFASATAGCRHEIDRRLCGNPGASVFSGRAETCDVEPGQCVPASP